eukprot:3301941-Prymnesium_polylepis.1
MATGRYTVLLIHMCLPLEGRAPWDRSTGRRSHTLPSLAPAPTERSERETMFDMTLLRGTPSCFGGDSTGGVL